MSGFRDLLNPRDREVLDQAIAHTRQRIGRDLRRACTTNTRGASAHEAMRKLLHAIRERFLDPAINVDLLMRELGINRNRLYPHFHATLGTAPGKYIRARRLDVARRLLRDTQLNIWKVGTLVGYRDQCVFGRAFKNAFGRTPSAVARRFRRYRPADQPLP